NFIIVLTGDLIVFGLAVVGAGVGRLTVVALTLTSAFSQNSFIFPFFISSSPSRNGIIALSPTIFIIVPKPSIAATRTGSTLSSQAFTIISERALVSVLFGATFVIFRHRTSHLIDSDFTWGFLCLPAATISSTTSDSVTLNEANTLYELK